jgi:hypothetical protein
MKTTAYAASGRAVVAAFALVLLLLAAGDVWALCPNCLGQSPSVSPAMKVVAVFLLVPPAVFFAVAIAVRKLGR